MRDATAQAYFPKENYYWSIKDEYEYQEEYHDPDGKWWCHGDGCVYPIEQLEEYKCDASGINWKDEESSDFYPSKTAHKRFTRAERRKQEHNYNVVITYVFKVKENKEQLRKAWDRVADRYQQERTKWLAPWDYAIINNTIRRLLSE